MVTFKNNNSHRRNNFRRSDRSFKSGSDRGKISNTYSNNENFQRKPVPRNINSISKLVEKYNNLAREALSSGDKILSENYFQHADHFTRILVEHDNFKKQKKENGFENIKKIDSSEKKQDKENQIDIESDKKEVININ